MGEEAAKKKIRDYGCWIIPAVVVCFLMLPCFCMDRVFDLMFGAEWPKPMRPKPVAEEVVRAVGEEAEKITGFGMFDLGGAFLSQEMLWRFEAPEEVVAKLVTQWKMHEAAVPKEFWEMGPTDWPRGMPAEAQGFQSPDFKPKGYKPEGQHYFLLYDREKGVVYVWFKSN